VPGMARSAEVEVARSTHEGGPSEVVATKIAPRVFTRCRKVQRMASEARELVDVGVVAVRADAVEATTGAEPNHGKMPNDRATSVS